MDFYYSQREGFILQRVRVCMLGTCKSWTGRKSSVRQEKPVSFF